MIYIVLTVLGLCLGSFVGALTWRIHKNMDFVKGRSQCDNCGHTLASKDLIPLLSWLSLRGRCRYCAKPISIQMPAIELATAAVFILSYVFWPTPLHGAANLVPFVTWLVAAVGLTALAIYDLRWMLLPNKILYPTLLIAVIGQFVYLIGYAPDKSEFAFGWLGAVLVSSGVFWFMYIISRGRWIGYGDVRLGLLTGTLLAKPSLAFLMIFLASLLGTLAILPQLIFKKKDLSAKIPYGPFLILATFICVLFGQNIVDWYRRLFIS